MIKKHPKRPLEKKIRFSVTLTERTYLALVKKASLEARPVSALARMFIELGIELK